MRLIKLVALGAGAAFLYKHFFGGSDEGRVETEAAQPFSSEQLDGEPATPGPDSEAQPEAAADTETGAETDAEQKDPLTQPSWLQPTDAA